MAGSLPDKRDNEVTLMARNVSLDPNIVRMIEQTRRDSAQVQHDWLPEDQQAARARSVSEIAGASLVTETASSGIRTAHVRVLGLDSPVDRSDFDQLLGVLNDDGARTIRFHILKCPGNLELIAWLKDAGFRGKQGLVHWIAPPATVSTATEGHDVRRIGPEEMPEFARIVGINYHYKTGEQVAALIHKTTTPRITCFLAYVDGVAVGTGLVIRTGSVCDLGYGTTLRAFRGRGIQQAIIAARVQFAHSIGCQWAIASTMGLDRSSRNLRRQGFRQAYITADFERTL